jgi:hypothetical protein
VPDRSAVLGFAISYSSLRCLINLLTQSNSQRRHRSRFGNTHFPPSSACHIMIAKETRRTEGADFGNGADEAAIASHISEHERIRR